MLQTEMYQSILFLPYLPSGQLVEVSQKQKHSLWRKVKHNDDRGYNEDRDERQESWCEEKLLEFANLTNSLFFGPW